MIYSLCLESPDWPLDIISKRALQHIEGTLSDLKVTPIFIEFM